MITCGKNEDGKEVFAEEGEGLRGQTIYCICCGAPMRIHRNPGSEEAFHFALFPGEEHMSVCRAYAKDQDMREFKNQTPDSFVASLCRVESSRSRKALEKAHANISGVKLVEATARPTLGSLKQIGESGLWKWEANMKTRMDGRFALVDYMVFDVWAGDVWKNGLYKEFGPRVVQMRWIGSLSSAKEKLLERIEDRMEDEKVIWFTVFFRRGKAWKCLCGNG